MPLRNITQNAIEVKYNGIIIYVEPGKDLDVRDFDVNAKDVEGVERRLVDKHGAAKFKVVESKEKSFEKENNELRATLREAEEKIADLEKQIETLTAPNTN